MLRSMRKHRSKVLGVLVVVISVVFVFAFGFSNRGQTDRTVAEVASHKITTAEYQDAMTKAVDVMRMRGQSAGDEDRSKLGEMVLNELIDKYLLLKKAAEMGITVSDREYAESLAQLGLFNEKNGGFNKQLYLEYVRRTGLDLKTFEENQKQMMIIQRVMSIIQDNGSAALDEKGAYEAYIRQKGQVKLSFAVFDPDEFKGKVVIDDKELSDLYEREKDAHRSENTFHLNYLVIDDKSKIKDDQAYMDLLKAKDLAAYGKAKGLEVVDLGSQKESDLFARFPKLKLQDALKGLAKGDVTLPIRTGNTSFIFQVIDREEGKLLDKAEAMKEIRARIVVEKAKALARMRAEDAVRDKGLKFAKSTDFLSRSATTVPGVGPIPSESASVFGLSKGQVFQTPVEVNGKFYVFAGADEKQPDKAQWDKDREMFTRFYTAIGRNAFFAAFKEDLRKDAKVKVNMKDL